MEWNKSIRGNWHCIGVSCTMDEIDVCVCNLQHIHIYMQLRRYMSIERWCKCKSNQFLYSIFVLAEGLTTAAKQTMDAPARWRSRIMLSSGYSMTQWPLTNMHDLILRRWHIEIEYIFYCASSVESHIDTRSYIYIYQRLCAWLDWMRSPSVGMRSGDQSNSKTCVLCTLHSEWCACVCNW